MEEILNAVYRIHNSGSKEYTIDDSARNLYAEFYNELASRAWIARDKNQDDIKGGALMKAQVNHQIKQKFYLPPYTIHYQYIFRWSFTYLSCANCLVNEMTWYLGNNLGI